VLPTEDCFPAAAAREAGPTADYARRWKLDKENRAAD